MDEEKVQALVAYVLATAPRGVLQAHIVNRLYLIDVEWLRATGFALTGAAWVLRGGGPWDERVGRIVMDRGPSSATGPLSAAERMVADEVGRIGDSHALEEKVSQTEPIRSAREGQRLDLRLIQHHDADRSFVADGYWGRDR